MSINRTSNPIAQTDGKVLSQYTEQLRQQRRAYLGDGMGNLAVTPNTDNNGNGHLGLYWIRFGTSNDNGGSTQFGEAQKARVGEFLHFPEIANLPLRVYKNRKNGEWIIQSVDTQSLVDSNINPTSYNFFRMFNSLWARMLHDGRVFIPNQLESGDTLYSIESYVGLWEGTRQFYEHGRGVSDSLDLLSYIPTADNERLVLVAYLPYEDTYQIVSGASRAIVSDEFDLTYLNTMSIQLEDYAMPKGCIRLQNAQTTVTVEDFRIDVRQWFLASRPSGFPRTISVPRTIISNYQELFFGSVTVDSTLKIDGELVEL